MATLTPTLTLKSTDALSDSLELTVTDSLSVLGQSKRFTKVLATTTTDILAAADYTKSYVYMQNKSTTTAEIITIGKAGSSQGSCSYNDDPTITVPTTVNLSRGMTVTGTGIPGGATVDSITNATVFELSTSTTGGNLTGQTLIFGMEDFIVLAPGEFCFFPWDTTVDLEAISASGTPTLEIMIFQAAA